MPPPVNALHPSLRTLLICIVMHFINHPATRPVELPQGTLAESAHKSGHAREPLP